MKISRATANAAPIIKLYGNEGRGKTTLACKAPKPLALLLERGLPRGVSIDAVEDVSSFEAVLAALRDFYTDPGEYRSLIIDTIDALEPLLHASVCAKNRWKNIETPPYGKGWIIADEEWRHFIRALNAIRNKHDTTIVPTCTPSSSASMIRGRQVTRATSPSCISELAAW
jgi:hypothetical protein